MNHNYSSSSLVVVNHVKNMQVSPMSHVVIIYIQDKCRFKEPFLSFQPKNIFLGISRVSQVTVESGVLKSGDYDGNSVFLEVTG